MLENIALSIDRLVDMFTSGFGKKYITDYIDIETVNDNNTLVSKDGSLITILNVRGNLNLYVPSEFEGSTHSLETKLNSLFVGKDHKIQIFFEYDHDNTRKELRDVMSESRATNRRLGLNLDDILNERENNLLEYVCSEKFYIALWTTTETLTKTQSKNQAEKIKERNMSKTMPITVLGQDPLRACTEIIQKHQSYVSLFTSALAEEGVSCYAMDVRNALREMRKCYDKKFTEESWTPFIPGDKILPSVRKTAPSIDTYDIMYPKISHQICPSSATILGEDVVEMGDRLYASVFLELFPQDIFSFQKLFVTARNQQLPWRYSMLIEGGGLSPALKMKGVVSQLLAFSSSGNKLIRNDLENLKEYKGSIVEVRATFTTWAPKEDKGLLATRFENLKNVLGSWGNPEVSKTTGDPVAAIASSALASTQGNIGTKSAAPLNQVLLMTPLLRPCSIWENGSAILRTPDGKILPYEPFSSHQTSWFEIIAAGMGAGKSVLMNFLNFALCLNPHITELPRIGIIDNGPSSTGLISIIREGLSEDMKHLAISHKFKNIKSQSVNPLDTPLGSREPTQIGGSFLINFVSLLVTDPTVDKVPEMFSGLVKKTLDEAYLMRSDRGKSPQIYNRNSNEHVDIAIYNLKKQGIELQKLKDSEEKEGVDVTWWEIVDFLFINGKIKEATLAQRHAVPVVIDLIEAVNSEKIKSEYSQETIESFTRSLKDSLDFYPVLSDITRFDVDLARVVSLDLDEVTKGGGALNERMTLVMYMIARHLLAKDFYIDGDIKDEVPTANATRIELFKNVPIQEYKEYHYKRGVGIKKEQKRLVYDELHRVSNKPSAQYILNQIEDDVRVGRKYLVDMMLASQSLTDFSDIFLELSTAIFVLDGNNQKVIDAVNKNLGLRGEAVENILKNQIKAPGKGGGVFLSLFKLKNKTFSVLASATLGPIELWAFSTTASDVYVRNGLYDVMKPSEARKLLSKHFPNGSIKEKVEIMLAQKQREKLGSDSGGEMIMSEREEIDIYDRFLDDLIELAKREGYEVKRK